MMDDSDARLDEICRSGLNVLRKHFGGNLETISMLTRKLIFNKPFLQPHSVLLTKCHPDPSPSHTQADFKPPEPLGTFVMKNIIVDV